MKDIIGGLPKGKNHACPVDAQHCHRRGRACPALRMDVPRGAQASSAPAMGASHRGTPAFWVRTGQAWENESFQSRDGDR